MKTVQMLCDGCGLELTNQKLNSNGVYKITHESCLGEAIWGDNRISKPLDYCFDCFGIIYSKLHKLDLTKTN